MTYIPEELSVRRRKDGVSQTAFEFYIKYCEHADRETGLTFATAKTCGDAFGMRSDNAQKYDAELQDKNWIALVEQNGKICRKMLAGWLPASERNKHGKAKNTGTEKPKIPASGKAKNTELLKFRKDFEALLNFRKTSYILGEVPKFKEKLLNFRNAYKEYIDPLFDQILDQLSDHETHTHRSVPNTPAESFADSDEANSGGEQAANKTGRRANVLMELPENFAISSEMRSWAKKKTPLVDIDGELEGFVKFWRDIATDRNLRTFRGWVSTWELRMTDLQKRAEKENRPRTKIEKPFDPGRNGGIDESQFDIEPKTGVWVHKFLNENAIREKVAEFVSFYGEDSNQNLVGQKKFYKPENWKRFVEIFDEEKLKI